MNFVETIEKWPYDVLLRVNGKIFNDQVVLKAAYELVDKVYMFFDVDGDYYKVYFKLKPNVEVDLENIVNSFGEELVFHRLRYDLDKKYGKLREKIIETALWFGLTLEDIKKDLEEVIEKVKELPLNHINQNKNEQINETKSIDDIIKEIENDPDFVEDKDEIISILKEIEEEEKNNKDKINNW
jgi:His-Xaa-Ser system protein HxsD